MKSFLALILSTLTHLFTGNFAAILGSDAGKAVEQGIVAFVKTDVGQLAIDAVQYASTLPDQSNDGLKAAAVAKLKADLVTAGKDATALGISALNLFIEMAFTFVKGTVAALPAAVGK